MRWGRWMLTVVVAAGLAGCGEQQTGVGRAADPAAAAPTASGSRLPAAPGRDAPAPRGSVPTLPASPTLRHPAALAAQLHQAEQTIRDPHAAEDDVRRAAWFEQLAARLLGRAPSRTTGRVLGRLHGTDARVLRADVVAARQLNVLTKPAPKLPPWRIVAPAPAAALRRYYHRAERITGVPWEYLAAINLVETRMGRIHGDSTAGAQGPMQFMPATWSRYGGGGDVHDPRDAILGAARLLRANGAPHDMARALWHYNQSERYVRAVTAYATAMRHSPAAYTGYWHWQVLYRQRKGLFLLPEGYPKVPARRIAAR